MTEKLTPKQETFCLSYIETGNASEAYRQAYNAENMKPETVNRKAKVELDKGKIRARVDELQAEHRERHEVTVDGLTEELEKARVIAMENKQPSAAVTAIMGKAKLHGLLVERTENLNKGWAKISNTPLGEPDTTHLPPMMGEEWLKGTPGDPKPSQKDLEH